MSMRGRRAVKFTSGGYDPGVHDLPMRFTAEFYPMPACRSISICTMFVTMILVALTPAHAEPRPIDRAKFADADRAIEAAIERVELPGAVLVAGRSNEIVYRKAYGNKAVQPAKAPMTEDTIF